MTITTGIVLFDDAEELDWAGPWEVFTMAHTEGDRVVTIAEHDRPVRLREGPAGPAGSHLRRCASARRGRRARRPGHPARGRRTR